ncbi:60S ribosomal protein L5-like protein, partial [Reticulomyxa filosa]
YYECLPIFYDICFFCLLYFTLDEFKPEALRGKIFGQHVADYMKKLQTDNPDKYNKQFSQFVKEGVTSDNLEQLIRKTHAAIRKDPSKLPKVKKDWKSTQKIKEKYQKCPNKKKTS